MGCANSDVSTKVPTRKHQYQKIEKPEKYKSNVFGNAQMQIFLRKVLPKILQNIKLETFRFQLLYQASRSFFSAKQFHIKTHQVQNTVFIAKSDNGAIFGGFTPCKWENQVMYKYVKDEKKKSFLFRVSSKEKNLKGQGVQFFQLIQNSKAILNNVEDGPVFGSGRDIYISDKCDINECWANLGQSYASPHKFGSNKSNSLLGGDIKFKISEYEIWRIIKQQ